MLSTPRNTTSTVRAALITLLAVTFFRLCYAACFDLVADEAYYWLWGKHLAASYRDKGPAIAWTIALGTKLFGDTVFGIRFFAVLLSSWGAWLLFSFTRKLYDDRVAWWCLVVFLVLPIFAAGSVLMTIDSLSVPFWALAVVIFWNIVQNNRALDWFWLGLAIGIGFLAKFTNGVQFACIGLFLLWSKEHRKLLLSWKPLLAGLAFLVSIAPIIWWNIQTGWIHAIALRSRSGVKESFGIHPRELLEFVGGQFLVMSPLIGAGMAIAAVVLLVKRHADLRTRFLLSQSLPLMALFLFFSINKTGKANWTAPALITTVIFTVVYWRELIARKPAWRYGVMAALGVAGFMVLAAHILVFLPLPPKWNLARRAQGWTDFATQVQGLREKNQATLLIGNHYSVASLMTFYLPDHPTTYLAPGPYGSSQFNLWPPYEVQPATRALYISYNTNKPPETLQAQFTNIQLVDDFWSKYHGRPVTHFYAYLCTQ